MMKIAIVGPTAPFRGGISHYTTLLYGHLRKKHNVQFYTFSRPYPKVLYPGDASFDKSEMKFTAKNASAIVDWANPYSWIKTGLLIKRWSPQIVIFPWWIWGWAFAFRTIAQIASSGENSRILFICHNVVEHEHAPWKALLSKLALSTGDFYIVHSQSDYENLKRMLPDAKVTMSLHPTYEVFNQQSTPKEEARKKLNIDQKFKKILLFFGIVRPYKGLRYLIEAMPKIISELPDLCLIIAGEFWKDKGNYLKSIEARCLNSNIMIFDDYIPNEEVSTYFSVADLVVLPYVSATGSGVTQIAFGSKKPVVATSVGDLPSAIEDGRRGLVVPPRDPISLSEAVIKCFSNNLLESFVKNIEADQYLFSWDNLIKVIENSVLEA